MRHDDDDDNGDYVPVYTQKYIIDATINNQIFNCD